MGRPVDTAAALLFHPLPIVVSDVDRFSAGHGLPALAPRQRTQVLPGGFVEPPPSDCPLADDEQKAVGDLKNVPNMTPGARLVDVAAANCSPEDIPAATDEIVDLHPREYRRQLVHAALRQHADGDLGDVSPATGAGHHPARIRPLGHVGRRHQPVRRPRRQQLDRGRLGHEPRLVAGSADQATPLGAFFIGSGRGRTTYPQPGYEPSVVPTALAGVTPMR